MAGPRPSRFGLRRLARLFDPAEEHWRLILPAALVVGLLSGASAVGLRSAVHELFELLAGARGTGLALLLPAAGAGLGVAIVAFVFREPAGHGVPEVIHAVCREGGRMRKRSALSRWLGSMVNVSSGGSAGLEGPIVFSGAAVGSTVGGLFAVDERRRTILLACGVAGGISGVFNAPMTGMIFAIEVVLAEWSALSIVPVVVSAVAATELARAVSIDESFLAADFAMSTADLLGCALLGIAAGLVSTLLVRGVELGHRVAQRLPGQRFLAPVLFGLGVGVVGWFAPSSIGEGYATAVAAIRSDLDAGWALCLGLVAAKLVTTSLTLGSGAPGGVFAPCLVLGALFGTSFHRALRAVTGDALPIATESGSYALVGMSGLVAGVMQAPLTGIFLVMEVTRGYGVILPLMIVAVLSLVVARHFDRYSLYTKELAERGDLARLGTDRRIAADVAVRETLDTDAVPVSEDATLAELLEVVKTSRRNHFPVLRRGSDELAGMLDLAAVRELLLDPELAPLTLVGTVMDTEPPTLPIDASLSEALELFERTGTWVLPVVEGARFAGLLSKSTLFDHYRRELSVQAADV